MLPTPLGYKAMLFFATLVASFYAAPYLNLFFLLLTFLATMGLLSAVWVHRNLRGLRAELQQLEPAPAGTGATAVVTLEGEGSQTPHFDVVAKVRVDGRASEIARVARVAGSGSLAAQLPPLPRGTHEIEAGWVESCYPFGLLRKRVALSHPGALHVYPAPIDLGSANDRKQLLAHLSGDLALATAQDDLGPTGLRDYRQGDEPRAIHWKASARRGELVVAEWEGEGMPGLEISLDLRARDEDLEHALSTIAALAHWAAQNKELLRLESQDHAAVYGEAHEPWRALWVYLASAVAMPLNAHKAPPAASPTTLRLPRPAHGPRGPGVLP